MTSEISLRPVIAIVLGYVCGCATTPTPTPTPAPRPEVQAAEAQVVPADPERGFHYPYILRLPDGGRPASSSVLLVEPNNTGAISDDLAVHLAAARELSERAIGGYVSNQLAVPLLVPVFPRPETEWQRYTHQLDRDTMLIQDGPMRRLDLQLLAMIDDARARLARDGIAVPAQVLMTGFSASGTFVNRFTVLHPERVLAAATGGLNGILILPLADLDGVALPYPLGLADLDEVSGEAFRAEPWRAVPQLVYMGANDDNDAVLFDDGYSETERATVFRAIGERMQPDRWERCQAIYRAAGANVTFRTYPDIGHGTDGRINAEIAAFLGQAMDRR